jgi:hypothetical protein
MGVTISLAYRIGLHRNIEHPGMEPWKKKLWKRIWWSCLMRDHLIALDMGWPIRINAGDYDVLMLAEDDFEIAALPKHITMIPAEYTLARDVQLQRELAQMYIAKCKLCLCVGHVLSTQYSVLGCCQMTQYENTSSSAMLFPKKLDQMAEIQACDNELNDWVVALPSSCRYPSEICDENSAGSGFVHRALLSMIYLTTMSALYRPQILPSPVIKPKPHEEPNYALCKVREVSRKITRIAQDLRSLGLERRYLPTTGVTICSQRA